MKGIRASVLTLLSIASIATTVALPGHANTLRWANNADITTVDPHGSYGVFNMGFVGNIYEGLVRLTRDYKIEPSLAVSWERVDPVTWRFKLRPGISFSNGEPMNADAVVGTIKYYFNPDVASRCRGDYSTIASATKVDDMTVDIKTATVDPTIPSRLLKLYVIAPNWLTTTPDEAAATSAVAVSPPQCRSRRNT